MLLKSDDDIYYDACIVGHLYYIKDDSLFLQIVRDMKPKALRARISKALRDAGITATWDDCYPAMGIFRMNGKDRLRPAVEVPLYGVCFSRSVCQGTLLYSNSCKS